MYEGYEARVGMQAMGARDQHGGGNTLRLDADDHDDDAEDDDDDHDDDADDDADDHNDSVDDDDGFDRWQLSLRGCRYVRTSQEQARPAFQPQPTRRTLAGVSFFIFPNL